MIIYKLVSPSGKCYIGKTKNDTFDIRWKQHLYLWKKLSKEGNGYSWSPTKLFHAFDKYHPDVWIHEILFECDDIHVLNQKEIYYIKHFDSIKNGYNITKGGDGRLVDFLEPEHKANISKSKLEYYETDEGKIWLSTLSDLKKGNVYFGAEPPDLSWSQEQKDKFSKIIKEQFDNGRESWNKGLTGIYDVETLQAISDGMKAAHANGNYDYKAMAKMRVGFKQPESQKLAVAKALQKEYDFINPEGNIIHIVNLRKFCTDNNLDQGNMTAVYTGRLKRYKKWTKA